MNSSKRPKEQVFISADKVSGFIASVLREEDEVMAGGTEHARLSLADQVINRGMRMRIAGCDEKGNELGEEAIKRDAKIIDFLHAQQVVTASQVHEDIVRFRKALDSVGGDFLKLNPKDFSFMQNGGHWPSRHIPALLPDIVQGTKEKTYALITEFVEEHDPDNPRRRVPFAYNFGFTQIPQGDERFPNMEPSDIAGKNGKIAAQIHEKIFFSWRVGVLKKLTPEVIERMAKELDVEVPDYLHGIEGRRRGLNNAMKVVCGQAAHDLDSEWMMYNTAEVHLPGEMAIGMPNHALRESNAAMFLDLGKRNHVDPLYDNNGVLVAEAEWKVYGNKPHSVLEAALSEKSVIRGKGGLEDIEAMKRTGHNLAYVSRRRQKQYVP